MCELVINLKAPKNFTESLLEKLLLLLYHKFHSGELHNLYSSPDIRQMKSRRMTWAGHVACMEEGRNVYRVLVGKPERKRPLEKPRRRWENGIKMGLREIGWGVGCGVDSPGSE
jgi:hypothetical protein